MPRVEVLKIWKFVYVAFTLNDYNEINDIATSVSRSDAIANCLDRHSKRLSALPTENLSDEGHAPR
jgi:hypothetical protein